MKAFCPLLPLLLYLLFTTATLRSQDDRRDECFGSTVLTLPFERTEKGERKVRETEYGEKDRFTFWYRIDPESDGNLDVRISSTRPDDVYDVSLYRYDGEKVCKELVHGDLDPIGIASLKGRIDEDSVAGFHPVAFEDEELKVDGTYYLSVLQVGGKGCGHIARFRSDGRTIEVRAEAKDCFQVPEEPERTSKKPDTTARKDQKEKEEPTKIELTTGIVDSSTGNPIAGELMLMNRKTGKKRFLELKEDSSRTLTLPSDRSYRLEGEALGYHEKSRTIELESDSTFFLNMSRLGKGEKIVLRRIYFHPNTYAFREESRPSIQALYRYMKQRPDARIEIQGHTASDRTIEETNPLYRDKGKAWNFTGTAEELSLLRAKAVIKELTSKGIDDERLRAKGFGASKKLVENPETRSEEQKNMRVEVRILK